LLRLFLAPCYLQIGPERSHLLRLQSFRLREVVKDQELCSIGVEDL